MSAKIYGPEQRERYSGPLDFIGHDIEALVAVANAVIRALEARVVELEGGAFAGDLTLSGDSAAIQKSAANDRLILAGGPSASTSDGAVVTLNGTSHLSAAGVLKLSIGNVAASELQVARADGTTCLTITGSSGDIRLHNGVRFGTHAAIGAETVTGYITITDTAGNSRKLAVVS
jgi:hypothetical protein